MQFEARSLSFKDSNFNRMQKLLKQKLKQAFPHLKENKLLDELIRAGTLRELSKGAELPTGRAFRMLPMVIQGTLKVFRENGSAAQKDLLLYYIQEGQSCAFSIHAILKNQPNNIRTVSESKSILLLIPQKQVIHLSERYEGFQKFLLDTLAQRFSEVSTLIESIAFMSMEDRIKRYLSQKAHLTSRRILPLSHQQIARDLASSREVISRILKQMEKKGEIKLSRGRITLIQLPKKH